MAMSRNRKRAAPGSTDFVANSRLRVAGPNCMGAYSYRERLFGYPNTDLCRLPPGSVACIFQSGGTIQFWMKAAADRGLRYSYCITSGNEPDLGLADYLNFVIDDPETRQVVLFIEGIRRPQAFMHAAGRALAMGKPILAIKTGATAQSQAASQSHTGAIAGDYAAYLAMCERYGIVNRRSLDDLVESALAFEGGRLPKGPRMGFVTTSGGTVDLLYDYAETEDAVMPDFSDATKAALVPMMQEGIAPKNPLDVGIPSTLQVAADICADRGARSQYRHGGMGLDHPRKTDAWGDVTPLRALLDKTDKPIVAFGRMIYQVGDQHIAAQQAAGFPFLQGIEPTIRALNGLWFHAARRGRQPATPPPAPPSELSPDDAGGDARALWHRACEKRSGHECRRSGDGGRAHRLSGRAEDPFPRHPAQDRGRRCRPRSAPSRRSRLRRRQARRCGTRGAAAGAHRRLSGAGDGIGCRGDHRRAQRSPLRPDAARRRGRRAGRARQRHRLAAASRRRAGNRGAWSPA